MPLAGMIVHASPSSPPQPPEDIPAPPHKARSRPVISLSCYSCSWCRKPRSSIRIRRQGKSTTAGAPSGSARDDRAARPGKQILFQQSTRLSKRRSLALRILRSRPAELGANNPNVNSPSSSENAGVTEAAQQQRQGEKPGRSNISLSEETAPGIQPAIGGSAPVMTAARRYRRDSSRR